MRVLITRTREQADSFAEALIAIGAEPVFFPTIQIEPVASPSPLDESLTNLERYDWLVFTSANAVEMVMSKLTGKFPTTLRVATAGEKTASSLYKHGIIPDFVPETFSAEATLAGLGDLRGKWVLLPLSDLASPALANAIEMEGGIPEVVTVYHTRIADPNPAGLAALTDVDVITFTSGSTVRNFVCLTQQAGIDPFRISEKIICIGPKTASVAEEIGFQVTAIAENATVEGLVTAIQKLQNL